MQLKCFHFGQNGSLVAFVCVCFDLPFSPSASELIKSCVCGLCVCVYVYVFGFPKLLSEGGNDKEIFKDKIYYKEKNLN